MGGPRRQFELRFLTSGTFLDVCSQLKPNMLTYVAELKQTESANSDGYKLLMTFYTSSTLLRVLKE